MDIDKNISDFFEFIDKRHSIWVRRNRGDAPPWTNDPILLKYRFCNVYRELDRGTQWYIKNIDEKCPDREEQLFQTIVYRLINTIPIFEALSLPSLEDYDAKTWEYLLRAYRKRNGKLFNPAYRIYGTYGKGETIKVLCDSIQWAKDHIEELYYDFDDAMSAQEAHSRLKQIPRVGNFLAYEILSDLITVKYVDFSENDFVNVGPGAMAGLHIIYGSAMNGVRPWAAVNVLRQCQKKYLYPSYLGRELTLRDIEHSLCEYRKYYNIKHNNRHGKLFIPHYANSL